MKATSTVTPVLAGIALIIGTAKLCPCGGAEQSSKLGLMQGRVGTTTSGGDVLPPESAIVYILFWAGFDTAGERFSSQLNDLLDKNKDLERLEKSVDHHPRPEDGNRLAKYYLQTVDEALAGVRSWLAKRPKRSWQMKTVTPDAEGFWFAEGLPPGGYKVVVRGTLPGYDADWEGTVDLRPGGTISLPLSRPRFLCRKDH